MFIVQIQETGTSLRYSGFGETLEQATADLIKHFRPSGILISPETVGVFHKGSAREGFTSLPEDDLPLALKVISDTALRLMPD